MVHPSTSRERPAVLASCASVLAALALFIAPFATLWRDFSGAGLLYVHPGRVINFLSFSPESLPQFDAVVGLGWLVFVLLAVMAAVALWRPRLVWIAGICIVLALIVQFVALVRAIDVVQLPILASGVRYSRAPFQNYGPSLSALLVLVAGLVALVEGFGRMSRFAATISRWRVALGTAAALGLSVLVGGIVILLIQNVPGLETSGAVSFERGWFGHLDLLWYSFSTLFGPILPRFRPILDLAGPWQSLQLATPLIFTGLGLTFAFRTGLFNIGAPGQIIMGGIACSLVGMFVHGPWWLIGPLAVLAAAAGGALWGMIPGWLKARFGVSEVINTIMLNQIASSLLVFMIGSETATFFGKTVALPFKAPGGEAKSLELVEGARLQPLVELFGFSRGDNAISFAWPLGLAGLLLGFVMLRGSLRRRLIGAVLCGGGLGVLGLILGVFQLPAGGSLIASRLNVSFLLALVAAASVGVFLWRTKFGYELRAVGLSPKAAEYGGVNIRRSIVLTMAISGALSGLAATHYVLGGAIDEYRLKQSMPADAAGFGGITVALLGQNTPLGVLLSAVLFGVLSTGGLNLDQALDKVSRDIVTVLQALIVVFIATRAFLSARALRLREQAAPANAPPSSTEQGGAEPHTIEPIAGSHDRAVLPESPSPAGESQRGRTE